jgi:hypothetical protein
MLHAAQPILLRGPDVARAVRDGAEERPVQDDAAHGLQARPGANMRAAGAVEPRVGCRGAAGNQLGADEPEIGGCE